MEISSARWISEEWEMEDAPFMNEFEMNPFDFSFDEFKFEPVPVPASVAVAEGGANTCSQIFGHNHNNKAKADSSSSSSHLISFETSNSKSGKGIDVKPQIDGNLKFSSVITESWISNNNNNNEYNMERGSGSRSNGNYSNNRNPIHARDHVIAERKRREKLTQRFIALSALIPGLNKVDKASILGGAVRHVKELQERLKVVEEEQQSAAVVHVNVKRITTSRLPVSSSDDDTSSSEENSFSGGGGGAKPEIEARVSNKDVLVRVHCHKRRKGCLPYLLEKIESLNLTILNSSALPFGHSKLDITIVAQVDEGFCMTVEDVVKNLRQALLDFN